MIHTDAEFRAAGALIDDDNAHGFEPPTVNGHKMSMGLVPRDYDRVPCGANGNEFPDELLIPEDEIKDAFEHYINTHSTLADLRDRAGGYLDSLDQNGFGLCWNFSSAKSIMYAREAAGLPRVKLSPWYGAGILNKWKDMGGWCEASAAFLVKSGIPRLDLCPKYSKEFDTPEAKADALNHQLLEFFDTSSDKDKRSHQCLSGWLRHGFSGPTDYNHMGHSMAFCQVVRCESIYDYDVDDDNSWSMKSGVKGKYRLKGAKARPDSAVLFRVAEASVA